MQSLAQPPRERNCFLDVICCQSLRKDWLAEPVSLSPWPVTGTAARISADFMPLSIGSRRAFRGLVMEFDARATPSPAAAVPHQDSCCQNPLAWAQCPPDAMVAGAAPTILSSIAYLVGVSR